MYHLLLVCCATLISFVILNRRYRVEAAYWLLAGLPTVVFIVATSGGTNIMSVRKIRNANDRTLWALARARGVLKLMRVLRSENWYPRQGSNLRPFAPEANALIH